MLNFEVGRYQRHFWANNGTNADQFLDKCTFSFIKNYLLDHVVNQVLVDETLLCNVTIILSIYMWKNVKQLAKKQK